MRDAVGVGQCSCCLMLLLVAILLLMFGVCSFDIMLDVLALLFNISW